MRSPTRPHASRSRERKARHGASISLNSGCVGAALVQALRQGELRAGQFLSMPQLVDILHLPLAAVREAARHASSSGDDPQRRRRSTGRPRPPGRQEGGLIRIGHDQRVSARRWWRAKALEAAILPAAAVGSAASSTITASFPGPTPMARRRTEGAAHVVLAAGTATRPRLSSRRLAICAASVRCSRTACSAASGLRARIASAMHCIRA
ncbi:hypothetical protein DPM13_12730 [Paracoccus mutanolyticus]|uniref:Uncharacterized protein n=1 Tax=Paracoccus mutanolyticus TaxID=1499308 RepID=A0ABM6WSM9_9RHOB|nr:hypothetical protein DPM13_12730 [Paracoccus mutanolyticus]